MASKFDPKAWKHTLDEVLHPISRYQPEVSSVLVNLALSRIKLHKNKRTEQGKILRKEVLTLLLAEKDDQARIRTVNVIHNDYYLDVLNTLEVFLNLVGVSTDVFAAQISVPLELKEAVSSIIYAAPFLDNSTELVKIRGMLTKKFVKDEDLLKTTFVHKKILLGLSHDMPDDALINYYISTILEEHNPSTEAPKSTSAADLAKSTAASSASNITPTRAVSKDSTTKITNNVASAISGSTHPSHPTANIAPSSPQAILDQIVSKISLEPLQSIGTFRVDNNGHFWVISESGIVPPVYIQALNIMASNESDTVLVQLDKRSDGKRSGKIIRNLSSEAEAALHRIPSSSSSATASLQALKASSSSRTSAELGMSALAAQHFVGAYDGILKIDSKQNAWVMDSSLQLPVFVPRIGLGVAMDGDSVTVEVFRRDNKLIGKIRENRVSASNTASSLSATPSSIKPASISSSTSSLSTEASPSGPTTRFSSPSVPLPEKRGVFKVESDNLGLVLDESNPLEPPVYIIGDFNRNGAQNGDRVSCAILGHTSNPLANSTTTLGQILSIILPNRSTSPKTGKLSSSSPQTPSSNGTPKIARNRNVKLLPRDSGVVGVLEINESGDGQILHPTLPWTYVIIPKAELGRAIAGDEISVSVMEGKPSNGKLAGSMVGIVDAVEPASYDVTTEIVYEEDVLDSGTVDDTSVAYMESALASLEQFGNEHQIEAQIETETAEEPKFPSLDRVNPAELIVIDIGSGYIKAGYANQPVPIAVIPALTGRLQDSLAPQKGSRMALSSGGDPLASINGDSVVGQAAYDRRSLLHLSHPLRRGTVSDWSAMRNILLGALTSLNTDLRPATVLVLESEASNLKENRVEFANIFLKDFKLPFLFHAHSSTCTLLSERRTSGIVVDLGHTTTSITPVVQGTIQEQSKHGFPLAGLDISNRLISLLEEDGYRMFKSEAQKLAVEEMKMAHAFVKAAHHQRNLQGGPSSQRNLSNSDPPSSSSKQVSFRLPDGTEILISDHAWKCTEILFSPGIVGMDIKGLHHQIKWAIESNPSKPELAENIILVGGTSLLPGLRQRLQSELQLLLPGRQIYVDQPAMAQFSAWIGGALMARLPDFKDCVLSREEFQTEGPEVIELTFV